MRKDLALELRGGPWDRGWLQLSGFFEDLLQTESLQPCAVVGARSPSLGWMDPSQMLDPLNSRGISGVPPGQPWHWLLPGMPMGAWVCPPWEQRRDPP